MFFRQLVAALALAFATSMASQGNAADRGAPCPAHYGVKNVTAKYGDTADQALDLYLPQNRPNAKLLVFVHGGGWTHGHRFGYAPVGYAFASCGIAVATVDYTLAPAVHADEMSREVARAVAWLQRNASTYGYAAKPMFLSGHSAGAQIVAFAAALGTKTLAGAGVAPDSIGGSILLDGAFYDPPIVDATSSEAGQLDPVFGEATRWNAVYGLRAKLTGKEAPMLVVHGMADTVVPESQSKDLYDELLAAGDKAEYLQPQDLTHSEVVQQIFSQKTDLFAKIVDFIGSGTP